MNLEIFLRVIGRAACLLPTLGFVALLLGAVSAPARADGPLPLTAALPPATLEQGPAVDLPQPLDTLDADRYRRIFRLQEKADWHGADALIGQLGDLRLLGNVLAHRYLHANYITSYKELVSWLDRFGDLPDAPTIYKLAMKKIPVGAALPAEPSVTSFRGGTPDSTNGLSTTPLWEQGLAAWRAGDSQRAATLFEQAAAASDDNLWLKSAAAYWAARSHLKNREAAKVSEWLRIAAAEPRTFYGQLARRALGVDTAFAWKPLELTQEGADALLESRIGQRALALIQVGEIRRAAAEFHVLRPKAGPDLAQAMLAVAEKLGMPSLTMGLGVALEGQLSYRFDSALFPEPQWVPIGGYKIDRALLFALARQESGFNGDAKSESGALGLMQIMPKTLSFVAKRLGEDFADAKSEWKNPEISLALGQEYVRYLLADPNVKGDLMLMAVAYNAGPGNLAKWRSAYGYDADPLLFLESIPSGQTRLFVERILAATWIYHQRFGQSAPSLDALAAGAWPAYVPQDAEARAAADSSYVTN